MVEQTYPSYIRASEISELVQSKSPSMDPTREFITKADYDELHAAKEALFRMHQDVCDRAIKLCEDRDFWKQQAGMVTNKLAVQVIENDKLRKIIAEPGEGNRYRLLINECDNLKAQVEFKDRQISILQTHTAVPAGEYETKLRLRIAELEADCRRYLSHSEDYKADYEMAKSELESIERAWNIDSEGLNEEIDELESKLASAVKALEEISIYHSHAPELQAVFEIARKALESIRGKA